MVVKSMANPSSNRSRKCGKAEAALQAVRVVRVVRSGHLAPCEQRAEAGTACLKVASRRCCGAKPVRAAGPGHCLHEAARFETVSATVVIGDLLRRASPPRSTTSRARTASVSRPHNWVLIRSRNTASGKACRPSGASPPRGLGVWVKCGNTRRASDIETASPWRSHARWASLLLRRGPRPACSHGYGRTDEDRCRPAVVCRARARRPMRILTPSLVQASVRR